MGFCRLEQSSTNKCVLEPSIKNCKETMIASAQHTNQSLVYQLVTLLSCNIISSAHVFLPFFAAITVRYLTRRFIGMYQNEKGKIRQLLVQLKPILTILR